MTDTMSVSLAEALQELESDPALQDSRGTLLGKSLLLQLDQLLGNADMTELRCGIAP